MFTLHKRITELASQQSFMKIPDRVNYRSPVNKKYQTILNSATATRTNAPTITPNFNCKQTHYFTCSESPVSKTGTKHFRKSIIKSFAIQKLGPDNFVVHFAMAATSLLDLHKVFEEK